MNYPHIHLMINHIPLFLPLFVLPVFIYGILKAKVDLMRLGLLAFIISGIAVWPVYYSGEKAEEVIENLIPQEKSYIETHHDDGELARNVLTVLGLFSIGGMFWTYKKGSAPNSYLYFVAALALASMYFIADAANSGGEIRHPEIRKGFNASTINEEQTTNADTMKDSGQEENKNGDTDNDGDRN